MAETTGVQPSLCEKKKDEEPLKKVYALYITIVGDSTDKEEYMMHQYHIMTPRYTQALELATENTFEAVKKKTAHLSDKELAKLNWKDLSVYPSPRFEIAGCIGVACSVFDCKTHSTNFLQLFPMNVLDRIKLELLKQRAALSSQNSK